MKKLMYSFAALALTASFAACGGKTEGGTDATDSVKDTTAVMTPTNYLENEDLGVTCPDGWEIKDGGFDYIEMEDVNSKETFKPIIKVRTIKDKDLKFYEDYYLNKTKGTVKGADVTYGEYTFKTFRDDNSKLYHCFAELSDGRLLEVYTVYMEPEAEVVKPVVESIKLK
ncbi:MAG: hypothetical protein IJ722_00700 [Alloprevotella sp.]|nr:hypothetical protein [Alloprevotella sp.]